VFLADLKRIAPLLCLSLAAVVSGGGGSAFADELVCPPNMQFVPKVDVVAAPAGFESRAFPEMHFLSGARLYDGDPDELAQLREDPGKGRDYGWAVDPPAEGRFFMLVCTYEGTEMTFVAAVPASAKRCAVGFVPEDARGMRYGAFVTKRERTEVVCK
jgi:hypothetical protein